jgi:hypothetical protein
LYTYLYLKNYYCICTVHPNFNIQCFWEKTLQKPTFRLNFKEIFFPYYIVWLWKLFFVILYLFEHFKVKYAQKSNKSLVSVFCKEKFIFFKNSCFKE